MLERKEKKLSGDGDEEERKRGFEGGNENEEKFNTRSFKILFMKIEKKLDFVLNF